MELVPYIMFSGQCEEALNFYAKALDGEIRGLMRYEGSPAEGMSADKEKILHASLIAKGITIMASDGDGASKDGGMVHLSCDFSDADEQEAVFNALSEGGKITMPLENTFWGARFGMLTDKFGIHWMFNLDLPKNEAKK
ncbi:MAG TPA: VOC family protein [Chitinophagaceae bacterium]|jgi:PhnB protein|nr:VOC family protein [Chitinophagaceae bacterium]